MQQEHSNRFLSLVNRRLRQERPFASRDDFGFFLERTTYANKPYLLPLYWFVTRGCSHDRAGGCSICNFGWSDVTEQDMLWQIDQILKQVADLPMIYITPLGSMFDDAEVPPRVRANILKKIARKGCQTFGTESRADTIKDDNMKEFRSIFGSDVELQLGIGLETADDYIRRNCINKGMSAEQFLRATDILHRYEIQPMVHILLKPCFLTESEAIDDAVGSINWAFEHGATRVIFFMTNLKPHTLAHWLSERSWYRVPYLWSGVEVLSSLAAEYQSRITLSGIYSGVTIDKLAHNCTLCSQAFVDDLQSFSMSLDASILKGLSDHPCACKSKWQAALGETLPPLPERLLYEYERIGRSLFGDSWWTDNAAWVRAEIDHIKPQLSNPR